MSILNQNTDMLARLISAGDQRQQVISHNIANVNTPNYQRMELDFEAELAKEIRSSIKSDKGSAEPVVRHTQGLKARADGNNVNIDKEMGELNKNALLQQIYLQLLGTEMSQMRRAMEGGQ